MRKKNSNLPTSEAETSEQTPKARSRDNPTVRLDESGPTVIVFDQELPCTSLTATIAVYKESHQECSSAEGQEDREQSIDNANIDTGPLEYPAQATLS